MDKRIELLEQLRQEVEKLPYGDESRLDAWQRRAEMLIRQIFGEASKYLKDLTDVSFHPWVYPSSRDYERSSWERGRTAGANLIATMIEELKLFGEVEAELGMPDHDADQVSVEHLPVDVFVVHGHDEAMKQAVARFLERLGLQPIILHEQPNRGRTIIEKFVDHAAVGFAVVLLSPDDRGAAAGEPQPKPRARQNVVFELGYFIGRLGRENVVALYRADDQFELPSDYSGVLFVPFDGAGRWMVDLVRELKAAGYQVDANKAL